jgi:hypothetical protein
MSKIKCWACGKPGHYEVDCPEESKTVHATWSSYATNRQTRYAPNEVLLDSASEVSVMNTRFLTNLKDSKGEGFAGLNGERTAIHQTGHLRDFFECLACNTCGANILSQSEVEDKYDVTYLQGEKYIVHLPDRDLEFLRKDRGYVADMSDWSSEVVAE